MQMDTGFTPSDGRPALNTSADGRVASLARDGWRELGFWYECDVERKCWNFRADRKGVNEFAAAVRRFLGAPESHEIGEHVHLGPYSNLRFVTAARPQAGWRGIEGRRADFEQLAAELEQLARGAGEGSHALGEGWASGDSYRLVLTVEEDGFDPASPEGSVAATGSGAA